MKVPLEALSPLQVGSLGADTPMQVCAPEEHQLNSKEFPGEIIFKSEVISGEEHEPPPTAAEQLALVPPPEPRHCQDQGPGSDNEAGEAVPWEQSGRGMEAAEG